MATNYLTGQQNPATTTSPFNWWPYPAWGESTTAAAPAPTTVVALVTTTLPSTPIISYTSTTITTINTPSITPISTFSDSLSLLPFLANATSSIDILSTVPSNTTPSTPSLSLIYISALLPAPPDASLPPSPPPARANHLATSSFKPIYLAPAFAVLGITLGALTAWCCCRRRRRRKGMRRPSLEAGPPYPYGQTTDAEDDLGGEEDEKTGLRGGYPPFRGAPAAAYEDDAFDEKAEVDLGVSPSKTTRHGAPYATGGSATGKWLAGVLAAQKDASAASTPTASRLGHSARTAFRWPRDKGYAPTASADPDDPFTVGATPRRGHVRGDSDVFVAKARLADWDDDGDDEHVEVDEGSYAEARVRPPGRVADGTADKELHVERAKSSASSSSNGARGGGSGRSEDLGRPFIPHMWKPASGFRIVREDPTSGALLSRESSTASRHAAPSPSATTPAAGMGGGLAGNWWPNLRDLASRATGGTAQGDRYTPMPARRAHERANSCGSATTSASHERTGFSRVASPAPTALSIYSPMPPTVRPTDSTLRTQLRLHTRMGREQPQIRDGPRVRRVDSSVLPRSPPTALSPPLEAQLCFGSPPASPPRVPPGERAGALRAATSPTRAPPGGRGGYVPTHGTPAERFHARRAVHGRVDQIVENSWSQRDLRGEVVSSPTMFGAHAGLDPGIEQRLQRDG